MPSTLLVTGAAGFIGSHLVRALVAGGQRVVGVDNFDPFYDRSVKEANLAGIDSLRFDLVEADVRDASAMEEIFARHQPEGVFHIAALAGVRPSILEPQRYVSVNVDGLTAILEAARATACRNVIFASSSSVYGNRSTVPFSETDDVSAPISPYAATKRAGELICSTYGHLFGMSIAALRFFTVYGPGQRPDLAVSKFMQLIGRGEEVPMYGDGTSSRDYTYVDDIVPGVLSAFERVKASEEGWFRIFNLGGAKPVMLADMIDLIGRVVGRSPRIRRSPMQPGDVERTFADLTRSREELGFCPRYDFTEGLQRQWKWMKESVLV